MMKVEVKHSVRILSLTVSTLILIVGCKKNDSYSHQVRIVTNPVENIGSHVATSGGTITSDGGSVITIRGVCWDTSPNPTPNGNHTTDGNNTGLFTSNITGLTEQTTYYLRAYALNDNGISYGYEREFTTATVPVIVSNPGSGVTDVNGNTYPTIVLGNGQEWMAANLRTENYVNGSVIPQVTDTVQWQTTTTGAWSNCNDNALNEIPYGKLYNQYAVMDTRQLCPSGWRVPSDYDWKQLIAYLDTDADLNCSTCTQSLIAGGKLKSTGTEYWQSPNSEATNEINFSALPGGNRYYDGTYQNFHQTAFWWSSTTDFANISLQRQVHHANGHFDTFGYQNTFGFSVRCIKNE